MKTLVIIVFLLNLIFCLLNILVGNFGIAMFNFLATICASCILIDILLKEWTCVSSDLVKIFFHWMARCVLKNHSLRWPLKKASLKVKLNTLLVKWTLNVIAVRHSVTYLFFDDCQHSFMYTFTQEEFHSWAQHIDLSYYVRVTGKLEAPYINLIGHITPIFCAWLLKTFKPFCLRLTMISVLKRS